MSIDTGMLCVHDASIAMVLLEGPRDRCRVSPLTAVLGMGNGLFE